MNNGPVRLGLYGCGNRTKALLESVCGEGLYEVAACFDICGVKTGEVSSRYGGRACASPAELTGAEGVDAFIISLDPFAHPAAFFETIKAGKPVFIEKPVAMDPETAFEMMTAADRAKVPVQVGFMRRFNPGVKAALRYIRENNPGTLFSISARWFHSGETEMINMLNNFPDNFRLKVSQIPFHCCHALDVMMLLGGKPLSVYSRGTKVIDRPYPSPDEVISSLEFETGAIGIFHYSSMTYGNVIDYLVHAENYSMEVSSGRLKIFSRPALKSQRGEWDKDCRAAYHRNMGPEERMYGSSSEDVEIMLSFLEGVRAGRSVMTPSLEDGWRAAAFAGAIEKSFETGGHVYPFAGPNRGIARDGKKDETQAPPS